MLITEQVRQRILQAAAEAQAKGLFPAIATPEVQVERPSKEEHGDFACSLPLKLARAVRMNPMEIARRLVPMVPLGEEMEKVEAAPPGFLNIFLRESWLQRQVDAIVEAGPAYSNVDAGQGHRVQVEFVSVNPTGPVHVGHTRGAVLGSTLANVLKAAGYQVTREYYINDAGNQMELFYASLYARYLQAVGQDAQLPNGGYQGAYLVDEAKEIVAAHGDRFAKMSREQAIREVGELGLRRMLEVIRQDLAAIGVEFDQWFSEKGLFESSQYQRTVELLRQGGHLAEREGAIWFVSTALGEDKDNVMVRSNGLPTYFASDAAYHYNKFAVRGFDRVINIWGADHQGHVPRLKAVVGALGLEPSRLTVIIAQMVALKRGNERVKASKRKGEIVTLRDLVAEVGPDACRFFFLARSPESQMEFDLELAQKQSQENPVYYVQYAHARIAGILRNAEEQGLDFRRGDVALLRAPEEMALIRKLVLLPELVQSVADTLQPHHLPHYATELATAFHWFYDHCRVITDDPALTSARLKLVEASGVILARSLELMGVSAPQRM
ncbi:MAG: arginine--tRNA ligase [Chloroflexi bacterium]|nr:arginine--tRNA ligase [Chloroflexota bacterium]